MNILLIYMTITKTNMSTFYHIWNESTQDYCVGNYDQEESVEFIEEFIAQQTKNPNDNLKIYKSKDYIDL